SPDILGFLKSRPTITVFFSLKAKTVAKFIEQNVLPSPLTDEVIINVLEPVTFIFLYKNCNEDLTALKDSARADFGCSNTARFDLPPYFFGNTPIIDTLE